MIANPQFGTVITASGSAYTWAGNSRENRLTPFANDPVADPTAEALFVRDDESGEAWCPTPGPLPREDGERRDPSSGTPPASPASRAWRAAVRHELDVFVDAHDPVQASRCSR